MSNQPFGQQPAFGAAPAPVQQAPLEQEPTRSSKTVVLAVAAGVVALGVLGGAAALMLGGGDDVDDLAVPPAPVASVEPAVPSTAPASPLPTAAVQGRNVFVPLVEDASGTGSGVEGEGALDGVAAPAPALPTSSTTSLTGLPGAITGSSLPLPAPPVTVTETVSVPGPVTTVTGPTVPGPTTTATTIVRTPGETVEVTIPGPDFGTLEVSVVDDGSTYPATFVLSYEEGESVTYADKVAGDVFGGEGDDLFTYMSFENGTLTFRYVSSVLSVQVVPVPVG